MKKSPGIFKEMEINGGSCVGFPGLNSSGIPLGIPRKIFGELSGRIRGITDGASLFLKGCLNVPPEKR